MQEQKPLQQLNHVDLGIHKSVLEKMREPLILYAEANKCHVSLNFLAVNADALKLHKYSLEHSLANMHPSTYKPSIMGHSLSRCVISPGLGSYTDAALETLNKNLADQIYRTDSLSSSQRKLSDQGNGEFADTNTFKRRSLPLIFLQESKSCRLDQDIHTPRKRLRYCNIDVEYPLSHFHYLHSRGAFKINDIKIYDSCLIVNFDELNDNPVRSGVEHLVNYKKVINGQARIPLDAEQLKLAQKELNNGMTNLFDSEFYHRYKKQVNVQVHNAKGEPVQTLGLVELDNEDNILNKRAIMADIDLHSCIFSENMPPSLVIDMNSDNIDADLQNEFNQELDFEYKILKSHIDKYYPKISANFDWKTFNFQLVNRQEMGTLSAREFFLLQFINHFIGRGKECVEDWMFQHGPSMRYHPQVPIDLTQDEPHFPAINSSTQVCMVQSIADSTPACFEGLEVLAMYQLLKPYTNDELNPIWEQQIKAYNDANHPRHWGYKNTLAHVKHQLMEKPSHTPSEYSIYTLFQAHPAMRHTYGGKVIMDLDNEPSSIKKVL